MSFAWHEIRDHLMKSSSTLGFQRSFDVIRRRGDPVAQFTDPAAVLDALHRKSGSPDQKNAILAALVQAARDDGPAADCAMTLMLLALWPGLDAIRRRSLWRKIGVPDEVTADILARTTETVRGLDLQRVNWIAATVLRNVERDMLRARQREVDRQSVISDGDPDEVADDHDVPDQALSHARLHGDIRQLIGTDAKLVIRVAVEGFTQAEAAIELGLSEAAARKRYQRATRKLRDALHEHA
ncbi:MAG: RNA polymerase sigma factor [Alphaproteobacteria bacterium]